MYDRELLKRVSIAHEVYQLQFGKNQAITDFVKWMYKQYGIIEPVQTPLTTLKK